MCCCFTPKITWKHNIFGPCSLFKSPNVNACVSHSVVTNTNTDSDRNTQIIQHTAVLTKQVVFKAFLHHWLAQLYLSQKKNKWSLFLSSCVTLRSLLIIKRIPVVMAVLPSIWIMGRTRRTADYSSCSDLRKTTGTLEGEKKQHFKNQIRVTLSLGRWHNRRVLMFSSLKLGETEGFQWSQREARRWQRQPFQKNPPLRTGSTLTGDETAPVDWVTCWMVLKQKFWTFKMPLS